MITVERDVDAPAERVWAVLADPGSWPGWTASMTSVELLDGPLRTGARARIRQPRLPAARWTVTEFVDGVRFTWVASSGGVTTTGTHAVTPLDAGRSRIVLGIDQHGPLAPIVGRLLRNRITRYVTMEADGLRAAAEAALDR